jgi:hypothetical protein
MLTLELWRLAIQLWRPLEPDAHPGAMQARHKAVEAPGAGCSPWSHGGSTLEPRMFKLVLLPLYGLYNLHGPLSPLRLTVHPAALCLLYGSLSSLRNSVLSTPSVSFTALHVPSTPAVPIIVFACDFLRRLWKPSF